jgi:ribosomal protein L36
MFCLFCRGAEAHVLMARLKNKCSGDWIVRRLGKLRALTEADSRLFESFRKFTES